MYRSFKAEEPCLKSLEHKIILNSVPFDLNLLYLANIRDIIYLADFRSLPPLQKMLISDSSRRCTYAVLCRLIKWKRIKIMVLSNFFQCCCFVLFSEMMLQWSSLILNEWICFVDYFVIAHSVNNNYNIAFLLGIFVMYGGVCVSEQHIHFETCKAHDIQSSNTHVL